MGQAFQVYEMNRQAKDDKFAQIQADAPSDEDDDEDEDEAGGGPPEVYMPGECALGEVAADASPDNRKKAGKFSHARASNANS